MLFLVSPKRGLTVEDVHVVLPGEELSMQVDLLRLGLDVDKPIWQREE
jgi:hypothetical protein